MHKLEQLIAEWRATLRTWPGLGHETLDELENHLRETISQFAQSGMAETEAFQRAVAQFGSPPAISSEFQKLNQRAWLPVRVAIGLGLTAALALGILLFNRFESGQFNLVLATHTYTLTLGYTATLLIGVVGICFVCQRCFVPVTTLRLQSLSKFSFMFGSLAVSLTAAGIVLGMLWSKTEWHRIWAWEPKETAALCVMAWQICFLLAHRFRGASTRVLLLMSVFGNVMVSLAWLGPNWLAGVHSYGYESRVFSNVLLGSVTTHLAFLLLGLAPAGWFRLSKA